MASRKRGWVRPAARPVTASDSRPDVQDIPVPTGFSFIN